MQAADCKGTPPGTPPLSSPPFQDASPVPPPLHRIRVLLRRLPLSMLITIARHTAGQPTARSSVCKCNYAVGRNMRQAVSHFIFTHPSRQQYRRINHHRPLEPVLPADGR